MILRTLLPLFFVAATGILILGVRKVLMKQGRGAPPPAAVVIEDLNGKENSSLDSLSVHSAHQTDPSSARASASEAMLVLEQFLKAKTLDERVSLMETTHSRAELEQSLLAKQLPEYRNITIDRQKSFEMENATDYFFALEFIKEDNSPDPYLMAVRSRGGTAPKVLADPILDLLGGRMDEFTSKPQPLGQSFYAVVSALPNCTDPRIPNREKKITLKLSPHPGSGKTINAYASKVSEIGEMLKLGNYDLVYGKSEPCYLLLGWNTEEREDTPYLEVLDIKTISWNP